ncbi:NAD(P)-dependent oxidoreductase, partial [Mycobacterium sp.]|uniref:NAD(P)-dependent oxidoreductase n=1 Tax=Mycobacterium sp. TaxID=1785 RepID=UPI003341FF5E|nr:garR 3 [Mycobacterium sp.]
MIDAGSEIPKIGFVGAGSMGEPMVERLLAAGWPVTVYARKADVRERLTARGAEAAGSIAEAVGDAPVVVLCPFSSDQLEAIALGSDGVLAHAPDGAAVVVHTTTSPAVLRCLADAAEREIEIIDAPVSGTADAIRAGALAVVLGGSVAGTERIEAVLRSYANSTVRVGELGDAALVKLLNNSIFAAHVQIAQSAVSSAQAAGVDPETFVS